ncbi:SET and MYND domain-containing protein DDB_G0273589-like isoform X2 [Prorops nasuta]|uniref:SET and MYND domain-containing protein DDB_G0273589-like isoform X2 n=1 Tax=Prorops nasuta TaxID=863751 RepID=UPI0034CE8700
MKFKLKYTCSRVGTFGEFYRIAYNAASVEPISSTFEESSRAGNRQKMIQSLLVSTVVCKWQSKDSFCSKNDKQAENLYKNAKGKLNEEKACILTQALFAASAHSKLFLQVLIQRAKLWFDLNVFDSCIKDCECMLALPENFYDSKEIAKYFAQCKIECSLLISECSKKIYLINMNPVSCRKHSSDQEHGSKDFSKLNELSPAIPVVEGKLHKTLLSCSDAVILKFDNKKGRQLVAQRRIKAGSILIVDHPFSFSTNEDALMRNCLHCHASLVMKNCSKIPCRGCQNVLFCSEYCRKEAWMNYHQYECRIFNSFFESTSSQHRQTSHLCLAYRTTVLKALIPQSEEIIIDNKERLKSNLFNSNFIQYHSGATINDFKLERTDTYDPLDYRTVLKLKTHCKNSEPIINLIRSIEAIFLAKCLLYILNLDSADEILVPLAVATLQHLQAINCNAYDIVENIKNEDTHVWEPRCVGGAIYTTVSLVNHSCYPNVVRHTYPEGRVVVRATRFIEKGSELLDCYGPHFLSEERNARLEHLWKKYRFMCACEACRGNWQLPLKDVIIYKCKCCSSELRISEEFKNSLHCKKCNNKIDCKRVDKLIKMSVEKRKWATEMMYNGKYEEALPVLLDHTNSIEKFLQPPSMEGIKSQQCIIQCYNRYGCTSQ